MDGQLFQTLAAGGIVLAAAAYTGRRWLALLAAARVKKTDAGCAGDCGCSSSH